MRIVLALIALALSPVAVVGGEPAQRPNILFVIADQWRASATGYSGDPNVKTPNLDRLATQSVNFKNAVSTCPVCSPFRASLITGQRATSHGIFLNDAHLSDDAVSVGKVLDAAGYTTGWIGKWHMNGHGRSSFIPREQRQGFEYWKVLECTHTYNQSHYFADTDQRLTWPGYDAFAQADDARGYIKAHAHGDKPFALFLAWGPPHNPYTTAPEQYQAMYQPDKIVLRPNVPPSHAASARKDLAGYYAHCSALDHAIGDLRQTLADAGIEQNTILVFTSDHGDMLGSHGMERKQKPWDEALRVPMLWHYPAKLGDKGKAADAVISSEDLMPTLLSLCGVAIPPSVEGVSFANYMAGGENPKPDNAALIECVVPFGEWNRIVGGKEYRGLRTERYTYVRDIKGPWLLYDDEKDPYQEDNLLNKPGGELQAKLDAMLTAHLKAAHDEFRPARDYLKQWGYENRVDRTETLPTKP